LKQERENELLFSEVRQQSIPALPVDPSDSPQNKSLSEDFTKGEAIIKLPNRKNFKRRITFEKSIKRNT
jgi:hypothetical protein